MRGITILGSTGSIGVSTLDVLSRCPDGFRVIALTANTDDEALYRQCVRWRPRFAVMAEREAAERLSARLAEPAPEVRVMAGREALEEVAALPESPLVMAAIVGAAGLLPTLAAVRSGKQVLLANKEALVMSGDIMVQAAREHGATLLPIDSEHNAIFQCMPQGFERGLDSVGVTRILLTASGGPFRERPLSEFGSVTPQEACDHPNWVMGKKISVDSATMMNKGLEVIEACRLFGASPAQVEVVLHPQSVIHSMVEYEDGSVLAQLGNPDMRTPIAHALAWPARMDSGVEPLDLVRVGRLEFSAPDPRRFPCLSLAFEAAVLGGTAPTVLNAANEVAVEAFLSGLLRFTDIPRVIHTTLRGHDRRDAQDLETILEADRTAREVATSELARHGAGVT